MGKRILAVTLGLMLLASAAFAAVRTPVQDFNNLPSSSTAGDTCLVILYGDTVTYASAGFWYPTKWTAPTTPVSYAGGVYTAALLPASDANNTCRLVYSTNVLYKSTSGTWSDLAASSSQATVLATTLTANAKLIVNGVRTSVLTGYEYYVNIDGLFSGTAAGAKTYGINVNMARNAVTTGGDLDDAGIKVRVRNNAACFVGNVIRGIDIQARNGATGTETMVSGGVISTQTDSGGTTTDVVALTVSNTLNGSVTGTNLPLDVRSFRQSATVPTLEAIARFRNGNTTGTGMRGIIITSEGGAPSYLTTCIDLSGALVTATGSDLKMSNGANVYSGSAATRAAVRALVGNTAPLGSMFVSLSATATTKPDMYIKVANAGADTDWERIVTQAAD